MLQDFGRIIETDVVAVGGSGAGITAAVYAARAGARVALVSKGKIGVSGNAIMAGGGFGVDGESGKTCCTWILPTPLLRRNDCSTVL